MATARTRKANALKTFDATRSGFRRAEEAARMRDLASGTTAGADADADGDGDTDGDKDEDTGMAVDMTTLLPHGVFAGWH